MPESPSSVIMFHFIVPRPWTSKSPSPEMVLECGVSSIKSFLSMLMAQDAPVSMMIGKESLSKVRKSLHPAMLLKALM